MKNLIILGAKPQFIKAGNLSSEISKHKNIEEVIVHTGEHYNVNMSNIFFEEMKIPKSSYFLGIGRKSIEKIKEVALKENPDFIIVYSNTNSTLACAKDINIEKIK